MRFGIIPVLSAVGLLAAFAVCAGDAMAQDKNFAKAFRPFPPEHLARYDSAAIAPVRKQTEGEVSLGEAMSFLTGFLPKRFRLTSLRDGLIAVHTVEYDPSYEISRAVASQCLLGIEGTYVGGWNERRRKIETSEIHIWLNFRQADPLLLKRTGQRVMIEAVGSAPTFPTRVRLDGMRITEAGSAKITLDPGFSEGADNADRLFRALTHIMKLCGGKVTPF